MAVSDYDENPNNNTAISGINVADGCSPAGINDALRQLMADVAGWYSAAPTVAGTVAKTGDTMTGTLIAPELAALGGAVTLAPSTQDDNTTIWQRNADLSPRSADYYDGANQRRAFSVRDNAGANEKIYALPHAAGAGTDQDLLNRVELDARYRQISKENYLTPEQYGAVGDGSADDAVAVQSWLDACVSTGAMARAYGQYRLDGLVTVDMEGNAPGEHLVIEGGGSQSKTFLVGASGGIHFNGTNAQRQHSLQIRDVHFEPNAADAAFPFKFTGLEGGLAYRNAVYLSNVVCGPQDHTSTNNFSEGPTITGVYRPAFETLRIYQSVNATTKWTHALDLRGCYSPYFGGATWLNVAAAGADYGIRWGGAETLAPEGFTAFGMIVNGADIGLDISNPGREPHFQWIGGHINANDRCLRVDGLKYGVMRDVLLYLTATTAETDEFIELLNVDGFELQNQYRTNGEESTRLIAMRPTGGKVVRNVKIEDFVLAPDQKLDTPPYFVGAGSENIEITLPTVNADDDFASLPDKMVEVETGAVNVRVNTAVGRVSFNDSSGTEPTLALTRFSETPADGDRGGAIDWFMRNDAMENTQMAQLLGSSTLVDAGAEYGQLEAWLRRDGSLEVAQKWMRPAAEDETAIFLLVREAAGVHTLHRVSVGDNNSGGTGKRALTIPNSV